ncbi:MAG: primosomal replication protein N'' PriC [Idiomarinaceae bacterium HL-53]|nr:MAG: primosomal replication protein N'' PriC [Idiomarinaceae bacterium HL-53]CUS49463.1 restart primosome assembly protein PriC [Idiomarinaceae bacterium HL-53]
MTQSQPTLFSALFEKLEQQCQQFEGELNKQWFEDSLFQTRSTYLREYIREARNNAERLLQLSPEKKGYDWLAERLEAQLNALSRALFRFQPPMAEEAHGLPAENASVLRKLHGTLVTYRGYETRLEDQLRLAQAAPSNTISQTLVLKTQQRLQNCQKAIADLERKIALAEEKQR